MVKSSQHDFLHVLIGLKEKGAEGTTGQIHHAQNQIRSGPAQPGGHRARATKSNWQAGPGWQRERGGGVTRA